MLDLSPFRVSPFRDDLFSLAYKRNVDLSISDCTVPKMRNMLPKWHRKLLPNTQSFIVLPLIVKDKPIGFFYADRPNTQSFIVLPLIVKDKPIGFFYADRQQVAPEGISSDEMKLIKILKGQVLTALNSQ